MVIVARFILLLIVAIFTYACTYFLLTHWTAISRSLILIFSFLPVLAITHFSVRLIKEEFADDLINTMFSTSFMFGLIGLLGGSIGGVILLPGNGLTFFLGFWTGPLGFLIGVFLSLLRWIIVEKRKKKSK